MKNDFRTLTARPAAAKDQKGKADPMANFTVRIVFNQNSNYKYYCHFEKQYKFITSVPRYSKRIDSQEQPPARSITKIFKDSVIQNADSIKVVEIYYNLNRGYRINNYLNKVQGKGAELVENIRLWRYTQSEIKGLEVAANHIDLKLPDWIYKLPIYDADNQDEQILTDYCKSLLNCAVKIEPSQARQIWKFFKEVVINK